MHRWPIVLVLTAVAAAPLAARGAPALVGGTAIPIRSAPWAVTVEYQDGPSSYYHCGGSIVDATHVVTAAYCLFTNKGVRAQLTQVRVFAGVSNYYTPAATDEAQERDVAALRLHPGFAYRAPDDRDDVAVLTVSPAFDLSGASVRALDLPQSPGAFPTRAAVQIAAFGRQAASTPSPGDLGLLHATVEAQGVCGAWGSVVGRENGVLFCASAPRGSTCSGDGGAGAVSGGVLIGVVGSTLYGDCSAGNEVMAASLASQEILAFVRGDDSPPSAPRSTKAARLTWKGPVRVGSTLTCSAGSGWKSPVHVSYAFVTTDSNRVLQSGARATYRVAPRAARAAIRCRALVSNDGGTLLVQTNASPNVAPKR
jgi:hypothetical protein